MDKVSQKKKKRTNTNFGEKASGDLCGWDSNERPGPRDWIPGVFPRAGHVYACAWHALPEKRWGGSEERVGAPRCCTRATTSLACAQARCASCCSWLMTETRHVASRFALSPFSSSEAAQWVLPCPTGILKSPRWVANPYWQHFMSWKAPSFLTPGPVTRDPQSLRLPSPSAAPSTPPCCSWGFLSTWWLRCHLLRKPLSIPEWPAAGLEEMSTDIFGFADRKASHDYWTLPL